MLTYGGTPLVETSEWQLQVWGAVGSELALDYGEFTGLGLTETHNDIHCVTHWSRYDNTWKGVLLSALLERAGVLPEAEAVMFHCYGGYTANVPLADIRADDHAMLAIEHDGCAADGAARGAGAGGDSVAVFLEEREVGGGDGVPDAGSAGLLGDVRVPHARGPVARRAVRLTASPALSSSDCLTP